MNRILQAVSDQEENIAARLADGRISDARVAEIGREMDLDFDEYVQFQDLKSIAVMDGTLTVDEAQYVFCCLGTYPDSFNRRSVAIKVVLTGLFKELLEKHMGVVA